MPPPLKGRALVDELCFKLPTYLQEQLGVTQIQVDARAGCTAADLDGFERNTGYALPADLRAFLAVSNGLKCDWAVDVKTRGPADVGALRLHRLDDIVPVTLDDDEADDAGARARTFRRDDDEGLGRVERAFELDRSARIGRVDCIHAPMLRNDPSARRVLRHAGSPTAAASARPHRLRKVILPLVRSYGEISHVT